jgi:thioredoxin 1
MKGAKAMANQPTLQLTDTNFDREVGESSKPVLVDFWAEWCQPCRVLGPTIDALAGEYANRVKIGKVDVDANSNLAKQYSVQSIPTVLLFVDGKVTQRFVGIQSRDELANALDQVISPAAA